MRAILPVIVVIGALAQTAPGIRTFGEVIPLGGTPSDMVLDEGRGRLYLINANANRVDVYDFRNQMMLAPIAVGLFPLAGSMSPDGQTLYVTNTQAASLSVIDLNSNSLRQTIGLPARPEGVAAGIDGRVLILTQGSGQNNSQNTLLIYDPSQQQGQQVLPVLVPPPINTPAPLPPVFFGRPATPYPGRLIATPDGQFIVGMVAINQQITSASTTLFVYEVASGSILRNRTVTGQSTVLSMAPDGSRFMAGSTLFDVANLNAVAQMNSANLPFFIGAGFNPGFNIQQNFGGSIFSPDGDTLYSAFNVAANTNPPTRPQSNIFLIGSSRNLSVRLGIRLPESILGRMAMTADGSEAWALSESGLIHIPLGTIFDQPIIMPDRTQVFLTSNPCVKGISKATVRIGNIGKGRLTFGVPNPTTALVTTVESAVAPSEINFLMEPGRSGVRRQPGTNLFTGAGGGNGTPINFTISSNESINIPNTIRVYMNFRETDQRGVVFPIPTLLNNGEGLQEMLLDERLGRVYISNSGQNRVEIFDLAAKRFLPPVEAGQLPRSMAMSLDGGFLYVGNTGGESISIIDLDTLKPAGSVEFPPLPRSGTAASLRPVTMAMGLSGLQFVMSTGGNAAGTLWRLFGNSAVPRAVSPLIQPSATAAQTISGPQFMASTPGGESILLLNGTGDGYLYDGLIDNFTAARRLINQRPPISYYGPLASGPQGSYFLANGLILSSALSVIGGAERPGQITVTPGQGQQPPTTTIVSAGQRNVASVWPIDENRFVRLTTPVRQNPTATTRDDARPTLELVDIRNNSESVVAIAPDSPTLTVSGTQRVNVPSRQLVVDSKGTTAYALTLSGLSVIPLEPTTGATRPQIIGGARGVINASDGTPNLFPGSFVAITGSNLASPANADELPPPIVLGGSCVAVSDLPIPLIQAANGQIVGQIPEDLRPGLHVLQVRSLDKAQSSDPIVVTVRKPN